MFQVLGKNSDKGSVVSYEVQMEQITRTEKAILKLMAHCMENKEIAKIMESSPNTIKQHCYAIGQKLDATNRMESVFTAIEKGIIECPLKSGHCNLLPGDRVREENEEGDRNGRM